MARIVEVATRPISVPLRRPFVTAVREVTSLEGLLVSALDEDGRVGWGEVATSWRVTGESPEGARVVMENPLSDAVLGLDSADSAAWGHAISMAVVRNTAAKSALDVALWDLLAHERALPLHAVIAPGSAGTTSTDMTISAADERSVLDDAAARVREGYDTLKIKLGVDAERDDRIIRALRDGPARQARLRIDANQGWSVEEAIRLIRGWEDDGLGVELVEQPTPAHDLEGLARVTAASETPILADESIWNARDLREIVRLSAADLINVKLAKCGGITPARELVDLAGEAGIGVLIGSMLESVVGVTAAAHLAASLPAQRHDLDAGLWLEADPMDGGAQYLAGAIFLPDLPGLGLTEGTAL